MRSRVPEWVDKVAWLFHREGKSLAQIAAMFDAGGIPPPSDQGKGWHASAVRRCVARVERGHEWRKAGPADQIPGFIVESVEPEIVVSVSGEVSKVEMSALVDDILADLKAEE